MAIVTASGKTLGLASRTIVSLTQYHFLPLKENYLHFLTIKIFKILTTIMFLTNFSAALPTPKETQPLVTNLTCSVILPFNTTLEHVNISYWNAFRDMLGGNMSRKEKVSTDSSIGEASRRGVDDTHCHFMIQVSFKIRPLHVTNPYFSQAFIASHPKSAAEPSQLTPSLKVHSIKQQTKSYANKVSP